MQFVRAAGRSRQARACAYIIFSIIIGFDKVFRVEVRSALA